MQGTSTNPPYGPLIWLTGESFDGVQSTGSKATNWLDISGNAHHFTNATAAYRPTYLSNVVNGRSAVYFNCASSNYIRPVETGVSGWWNAYSSYDIFYVLRNTNTWCGSQGWGLDSFTYNDAVFGTAAETFNGYYTNQIRTRFMSQNQKPVGSIPWAFTNWHSIHSHSKSGEFWHTFNGAYVLNGNNTFGANLNDSYANIGRTLYSDAIPVSYWAYYNGWIAEMLIYAPALTSNQTEAVTTWLLDKYAITKQSQPDNTAVFDGVNDYMNFTSSGPTGLADGKAFTFSAWIRFDGGDGSDQRIIGCVNSSLSTRFFVRKTTANLISLLGLNSSGTTILNVESSDTLTAASGWAHVYACVDMSDSAKRKIYINGSPQTLNIVSWTDDTIDMVSANAVYWMGATTSAAFGRT